MFFLPVRSQHIQSSYKSQENSDGDSKELHLTSYMHCERKHELRHARISRDERPCVKEEKTHFLLEIEIVSPRPFMRNSSCGAS